MPHLEYLHQHVRSFATIMAQRRGQELPAWLEDVEADDLPELRSLAAGMRRHLAAVINGLTLEHDSCVVEGSVTRVKQLKRDGYGRASFDLLRAQTLPRRLNRRQVILARAELQDRRHVTPCRRHSQNTELESFA
jgi:transposase